MKKLSDTEIRTVVKFILRNIDHPSRLRQRIANGLIGRLEDHDVTEADLERLGLI